LTGYRELIPDWVLELPLEEKLRRSREFSAWTQTYPKNITGDAASTYWKPWILMVLTFHQLETNISQYSEQLDFCTHSLLKTSLKLWIKMWVQEDFETVLQIYTKYDCSWVKDFGSTSILYPSKDKWVLQFAQLLICAQLDVLDLFGERISKD
jgi:hypothetical protein